MFIVRFLFAGATTGLAAVSSQLLDLSILGVITALNVPFTILITTIVNGKSESRLTWACCLFSVLGVTICINPFKFQGGRASDFILDFSPSDFGSRY